MNSVDQFETIVGDHYAALYRYALSLTRHEADARDLTQHTFYVWAGKGHQLRDGSKVKAWLFTTLHRAFLGGRRKQSKFTREELSLDEVADQSPLLCTQPAEGVDSPQVLSALGRVDKPFQAAVALFYLQDCSYKEIAVILGIPVGTVKSRIARGVAQLRTLLRVETLSRSDASPDVADARPARISSTFPEASPGEWDLSSTLLPEPIGSL